MVRLVHADLFVPTRVIEKRGKLIMHQSVLELKQEQIAKLINYEVTEVVLEHNHLLQLPQPAT